MYHLLTKKSKIRRIFLFWVFFGCLIFLTISCGCSARTLNYDTNIKGYPTKNIFQWGINNLLNLYKTKTKLDVINSYKVGKDEQNPLWKYIQKVPLEGDKTILFFTVANSVKFVKIDGKDFSDKEKIGDLSGDIYNLNNSKINPNGESFLLEINLSFSKSDKIPINTSSYYKDIAKLSIYFRFNNLIIPMKPKQPQDTDNNVFELITNITNKL